jgi:hypothetical protein
MIDSLVPLLVALRCVVRGGGGGGDGDCTRSLEFLSLFSLIELYGCLAMRSIGEGMSGGTLNIEQKATALHFNLKSAFFFFAFLISKSEGHRKSGGKNLTINI